MIELSLAAFAASFVLVVLAEMGDKTQFLAMSFAARHNIYKVIIGVFLAILASFAVTITLGQLLTSLIPLDVISLAASISFIGFGLWTVRGDKFKIKNEKTSRFGVVGTVATAFFIAEFGDKTQLATISLTAQYNNALSVFVGATIAMLVADGVGIVVGVVFCKRIPERTFRWLSAGIFVLFGLVGVYEVLSIRISLLYTAVTLLMLVVFSVVVMAALARKRKSREYSDQEQVCKQKT